jgi:DNA-binding NtrC family response regulator
VSRNTSILLLGGAPSESSRLKRSLSRHFLLVETASELAEASDLAARCRFHVLVLLDPGESWDAVNRRLGNADGLPARTVLITDRSEAERGIEALRSGVADVLLRPFSTDQLVATITSLSAEAPEQPAGRAMPAGATLVGEAPSMQAVRSLVERIAPTPATVLIEGETGTGKELVARLVHECSGRRGPFVPINCGAIAPELLESELFGHTRGAFTSANRSREGLFVAARGGTLFLDEVHEMRLDMEVKLLRTLEENRIRPVGSDREIPIDCRIVASTQSDLGELVAEHRFREDLYYRLNVIHIKVPPLRERREDIPLLVGHFLARLSTEMNLTPVDFDDDQLAELQAHDWPGNVRELRNIVERGLLLGRLPADLLTAKAGESAPPEYPLDWTLEEVKRHHMSRVLEDSGGNKSAAARRLDISRKTLERKLGVNSRK